MYVGICWQSIVVGHQWTSMTRLRAFFVILFSGFKSRKFTLILCTDINITETTYSFKFQYVFCNQ